MARSSPIVARPGSVRALITELAQIEDAVRRTRTYPDPNGAEPTPLLNPQLVTLFRREAEIIAALRCAAHEVGDARS